MRNTERDSESHVDAPSSTRWYDGSQYAPSTSAFTSSAYATASTAARGPGAASAYDHEAPAQADDLVPVGVDVHLAGEHERAARPPAAPARRDRAAQRRRAEPRLHADAHHADHAPGDGEHRHRVPPAEAVDRVPILGEGMDRVRDGAGASPRSPSCSIARAEEEAEPVAVQDGDGPRAREVRHR
jgi:hypothetical protein